MLRRDARAGELRVLAAALVLAVASAATVGFFTDRVKSALFAQANQLLGADLLVAGDRPLPSRFAERARELGLNTIDSIRFNSMVQTAEGGDFVLAEIKSVDTGYPLRGEILLADPARPGGRAVREAPGPGTVWVDTRLVQRLGVQPGNTLAVGEARLRVTQVVQQEPEVSGGFLSLGPKLMMNAADVVATNLLQPGNRATHRLLVAGPRVGEFGEWARGEIGPGQRIETIRDLRPEIRQTLERAEKFLGLAALVAVILAAVAVALAAARYLQRHLDAAAVMRCLGAPQRQTLALYLTQFLLLGAAASVAGVLIGLVGQQVLVAVLGTVFPTELPSPGLVPALHGLATGFALLFGFAVPPLVALTRVPPLRVLRRDLGVPKAGGWFAYAAGALVVGALVFVNARDPTTGLIMLGGIAGLLAVATLVARILVWLVRFIPQRGYGWRYGLANLRRRPLASSLQIGTLGLGLMALLLLTLVRGDLLANWKASLPPDAPNKFVINILPDQIEALGALVAAPGRKAPVFYPMIRGRLVGLNDKEVGPADFPGERARRLVDREFNLSAVATLPAANHIVSGSWWPVPPAGAAAPGADLGFSLEDGVAETLGIKLSDRVTFDVAGTRVSARVTSLRKVDWDSFRVNFFALFPPGPLDALPKTYITSFRLNEADAGIINRIVQGFPNALLIDVAEIMNQVQRIMTQVSRAVEFVFLFTLAAGMLVLQAAIAATQDERRYDAAVLRTLGARRAQLRSAQIAEFLVLGALAGVLAAGGATAVAWFLAQRVFQIPYTFNASLWAIGVVVGAVAVAFSGWLGTRGTLAQSPLAVIRRLQ